MTAAMKKQVMKEIGKTARSIAPMAKRILLFGSQARGDAREDSGWELGEDISTVLYCVLLNNLEYE